MKVATIYMIEFGGKHGEQAPITAEIRPNMNTKTVKKTTALWWAETVLWGWYRGINIRKKRCSMSSLATSSPLSKAAFRVLAAEGSNLLTHASPRRLCFKSGLGYLEKWKCLKKFDFLSCLTPSRRLLDYCTFLLTVFLFTVISGSHWPITFPKATRQTGYPIPAH